MLLSLGSSAKGQISGNAKSMRRTCWSRPVRPGRPIGSVDMPCGIFREVVGYPHLRHSEEHWQPGSKHRSLAGRRLGRAARVGAGRIGDPYGWGYLITARNQQEYNLDRREMT